MNYAENIAFLKSQLDQTQQWLEMDEQRPDHVITMIIRGMIETEYQIGHFEDMNAK